MDGLRVMAEASGYFTRHDAMEIGYDDPAIRRAIRSKLWRRIRPGVYTFSDLWPDSAEDLHRILALAVARKFFPNVAVTHTSAAVLRGLRLWNADLSHVQVTRLDGGAGRTEAGVHHHEGFLLPDDLTTIEGVPTTKPARAALEAASLLPTESALVTLDSVLHLELCTREELESCYRLMHSWPGMLSTSVALRLADGGGQSVGETRSRYAFYTQGLPAPELQYEVRDSSGRVVAITDWAWPEHQLLGEFDGRIKYGRLLNEGESPGDAVFREKMREDMIRELTGWRLIRFVWADLYDPIAIARRVRRLMRLAA